MEVLAGMRNPDEGSVTVLGKTITPECTTTAAEMRKNRVGHIPEDRHKHGLVLSFGAYENMVLGFHRSEIVGEKSLLDRRHMLKHCAERMQEYDIRPKDPSHLAKNFSGGNQQKIVVAREIFQQPKLLIVGEPTRGVDIGAIEFIHKQLIELRDRGCAIILVSVELDEILGLSDRILVMNNGEAVATVNAETTSVQEVGLMMAGVTGGEASCTA